MLVREKRWFWIASMSGRREEAKGGTEVKHNK